MTRLGSRVPTQGEGQSYSHQAAIFVSVYEIVNNSQPTSSLRPCGRGGGGGGGGGDDLTCQEHLSHDHQPSAGMVGGQGEIE